MLCRKCKKDIEDDSIYCRFCGRKQNRERLNYQKRPNGTGSVYKLPGNRNKPWTVVITKPGQKRTYGGFYETKAEAMVAASKLVEEGISDRHNDTIQNVYDVWSKKHFEGLTGWGKQGYETAWTYFSDIKHLKIRDIKTDTLQTVVNKAIEKGKSRGTCEKIRNLASQLCKYAMQQDVINKNYAQFLVLPKQDKKEKSIFTDEEIKTLWEHSSDNDVKIILTLIYTGFRIDELFSLETKNVYPNKGYVIGGEKTEAGRDRIIPINDKIKPFINEWYQKAINNKHTYLITNSQGGKIHPGNFRNRNFYKVLADLNFQPAIDKDHPASKYARLTPHSTRHTFASLASKAGVKPETLQKLIGHAKYETTADVYIHDNFDQLKEGISKI